MFARFHKGKKTIRKTEQKKGHKKGETLLMVILSPWHIQKRKAVRRKQ